jgi:signal transduction histidine kinase
MQTKNLLVLSVMAIAYTLLWFAMAALLGARIHDPLFQGLFAVVMIATFTFSYTPLYAAVQMSVRNLRGGIPATTSAGFAQMINALHEQTQLDALVDLVEKRLLVLLGQSSARLVLTMPGRAELSPEFAGNRSMWDTLRMTRAPVTADGSTAIPVIGDSGLRGMLLLRGTLRDDELLDLLQFLARQIGIAVDRIEAQERLHLRMEAAHDEKIQALATLSANIAHEMRTPLAGVRASISGVEAYLPELLEAYPLASAQQPERFAPLRHEHAESLASTSARIKDLVDQANNVIDLLLVNLHNDKLDRESFTQCSMRACVEEALASYPFRRNEQARVSAVLDTDFCFQGIHSMMVYVFFNLLKNALYSLEAAGKGAITIHIETGADGNRVIFRDTGLGITADVLPHIFDGFFTTRADGTGAGLAFCMRTLASFDADIQASAVAGEYACFTLTFPDCTPLSAGTSRWGAAL